MYEYCYSNLGAIYAKGLLNSAEITNLSDQRYNQTQHKERVSDKGNS